MKAYHQNSAMKHIANYSLVFLLLSNMCFQFVKLLMVKYAYLPAKNTMDSSPISDGLFLRLACDETLMQQMFVCLT